MRRRGTCARGVPDVVEHEFEAFEVGRRVDVGEQPRVELDLATSSSS